MQFVKLGASISEFNAVHPLGAYMTLFSVAPIDDEAGGP